MWRDGGLLLLFFLLHGDRDGSVRRQADLVAFHLGDQVLVDEVMMSPVAALAAVLLRQFDLAAFDLSTVPMWTPSAPITSIFSLMSVMCESLMNPPNAPAAQMFGRYP